MHIINLHIYVGGSKLCQFTRQWEGARAAGYGQQMLAALWQKGKINKRQVNERISEQKRNGEISLYFVHLPFSRIPGHREFKHFSLFPGTQRFLGIIRYS